MVFDSKLVPLVFLILAACSDRPSHEKFPGGQGRTTEVQQADTTRAVLGGFDPLNNPLARNTNSPSAGKDGVGPTIKGRVEADSSPSTAGKVLFIFARSEFGGPPLAVKRLESPQLPLNFVLSEDDRMAQHTVFEGKVTLHARLDSDGSATTTLPGDWVAEQPAKVGDSGIVLKLSVVK
jgi:hypothetical protein